MLLAYVGYAGITNHVANGGGFSQTGMMFTYGFSNTFSKLQSNFDQLPNSKIQPS